MRSLTIFLLLSAFVFTQEADPDTNLIDIDFTATDSTVVDSVVVEPVVSDPVVSEEDSVAVAVEPIPADSTLAEAEEEIIDDLPEAAEPLSAEADADYTGEVMDQPDTTAEAGLEKIGPLPMELSYGYKGFRWGSPKGSIPRLKYADSIIYEDSMMVRLSGQLGTDQVTLSYHFADSGFWKVEIDFEVDQDDIDAQLDQFLRIEKGMSEIYGPPQSTNQIYSGPSPSYNGAQDVNFSRAFYRSGWSPLPVRIELLLNGAAQHSGSLLPVFSNNFSILKMVYYNPDYMHYLPASERTAKLPSIFEIY